MRRTKEAIIQGHGYMIHDVEGHLATTPVKHSNLAMQVSLCVAGGGVHGVFLASVEVLQATWAGRWRVE